PLDRPGGVHNQCCPATDRANPRGFTMPTTDGVYQRTEFADYTSGFKCAKCGSPVIFEWVPIKGFGGVSGYVPGKPQCTASDCEFHEPQRTFGTRVVPRNPSTV